MKKTFKIIIWITAITATFVSANNLFNKNNQKLVNVLWQDASRWDGNTAKKVAEINPDKFIINIDGPYSLSTPTTGPHPMQLKEFIDTLVNVYGWSGVLVMHPDCNKLEFKHDWNNGSKWFNDGWKLYVDYMKILNNTLKSHKLPLFTELLIETEGSGMTSKANIQSKIFDNFRSYINDSSIKLSATSDWNKKSFPTSADYYYAQMYDVCYSKKDGGIPSLCGINNPNRKDRVNTLVTNMVNSITLNRIEDVTFIFTYAPYAKCPSITEKNTTNPSTLPSLICKCPHFGKPYCPTLDSPMFGGDLVDYWNKSQFSAFSKEFKDSTNNASVGIWHCESPLKQWK
tara:strand:- start:59 stop:1087 length:1029 start_codon:yes stop_codon:yes gene_type:complete